MELESFLREHSSEDPMSNGSYDLEWSPTVPLAKGFISSTSFLTKNKPFPVRGK